MSELQHLTEVRVSEITGLTLAWLRRARVKGGGPPFRKLGACVRYPESDLAVWLASHKAKVNTAGAEIHTP